MTAGLEIEKSHPSGGCGTGAGSGLFHAEFGPAVRAVHPLVETLESPVDNIVGPAVTTDIRPQIKPNSSPDRAQMRNHRRGLTIRWNICCDLFFPKIMNILRLYARSARIPASVKGAWRSIPIRVSGPADHRLPGGAWILRQTGWPSLSGIVSRSLCRRPPGIVCARWRILPGNKGYKGIFS